uniref:Uncharacterized protein n=1 Tax=Anguilla anguilla TaxID=7936 RepID=A0A0E9WXQ3_ANGAN
MLALYRSKINYLNCVWVGRLLEYFCENIYCLNCKFWGKKSFFSVRSAFIPQSLETIC